MNLTEDIISILMALMLTSTSLAGPSSLPVIKESITSMPLEEIIAEAGDNDAAFDALAALGTVNMLADTQIVSSHTVEVAGNAAAGMAGALGSADVQDDESLWYCSRIPMKKEHQKLLWDCCNELGLDYIDMLALISLESNFNEKCSNGKYKGYFQLSADHGPKLSKILGTENKPLDGTINIKWGTTFYSWILQDKRVKDKEGKEKRDIALSIYQRGSGGYDRLGLSKSYLAKYYKKRDIIVSYFDLSANDN